MCYPFQQAGVSMKCSEQLPDFFILGAEKSGTTSLYYYLNQHPDIFFPEIKEPGYFSYVVEKPRTFLYKEVDWSIVVDNLDDYGKLYEPALPGQLRGDASTVYLYDYKTVIDQISAKYDLYEYYEIIPEFKGQLIA